MARPGDDLDDELVELLEQMDGDAFGEAHRYRKGGSYWWVAYDGSLPVGYCGLTPQTGYKTAFICRVAVAVTHRGRGLQRRFLRACERLARARGIGALVTYVADWNVTSANNFIRTGFELYRPAHEYGVAGALYFRKPMKAG